MLKNKKLLVITSLVTLFPMLAGILLWNRLLDKIPIHWNSAGEIDGWGSKPFAVFGLTLIIFACQWLCILASLADPKNKNQGMKPIKLVLWICPVMSIWASTMIYTAAMGVELSMELLMPVLMGVLFIIVGNYLPKCKQNYTIGIKIPWTLDSEENWNQTHRMAGRLWVIGGILMIFAVFLPNKFMVAAMVIVLLVMVTVPMIYSYRLYKNR